jgi:hypothetical protein
LLNAVAVRVQHLYIDSQPARSVFCRSSLLNLIVIVLRD